MAWVGKKALAAPARVKRTCHGFANTRQLAGRREHSTWAKCCRSGVGSRRHPTTSLPWDRAKCQYSQK
eukprot:5471472-Pyramimonas_sp.AAC.1